MITYENTREESQLQLLPTLHRLYNADDSALRGIVHGWRLLQLRLHPGLNKEQLEQVNPYGPRYNNTWIEDNNDIGLLK